MWTETHNVYAPLDGAKGRVAVPSLSPLKAMTGRVGKGGGKLSGAG